MGKCNSLLRLLLAMPIVAFATTNETVTIRDIGNTPYARATKAGESKDWERFRYWAELIPEEERDSRIRDWLAQLQKEGGRGPTSENSIPQKIDPTQKASMSYIGPVREYVVQRGDYISKISRNNDIPLRQLKEMNGLTSDTLKVGRKLFVPVKINSKCQVRVVVRAKSKSAYGVERRVTRLIRRSDIMQACVTSGGVSQYKYHSGNGVFDLLLCSDTPSDDVVAVKVEVNGEEKNVFVQFQEGISMMEVVVE